ncbi:MAG: DinB family protein [Actinomycetota bacterium]|nr:DinB family protein [Actinomycetota bacterium]
MDHTEILVEAFTRIRDLVYHTLDGLPAQDLTVRLDPEANTIAWLIWHLSRVQDDHIAELAGHDQVWLADGWYDRFELPFDGHAIGYGQSAAEVGQVSAPADLLTGYHDALHARSIDFVRDLSAAELDRVVDRRWDPPVTVGVRLVSVISDDLQHVGQAAYVRGVLSRRD